MYKPVPYHRSSSDRTVGMCLGVQHPQNTSFLSIFFMDNMMRAGMLLWQADQFKLLEEPLQSSIYPSVCMKFTPRQHAGNKLGKKMLFKLC